MRELSKRGCYAKERNLSIFCIQCSQLRIQNRTYLMQDNLDNDIGENFMQMKLKMFSFWHKCLTHISQADFVKAIFPTKYFHLHLGEVGLDKQIVCDEVFNCHHLNLPLCDPARMTSMIQRLSWNTEHRLWPGRMRVVERTTAGLSDKNILLKQ